MSFIKIRNTGLIEREAFTLIGASSKRDDETKIGFFGSGLKYSLAVLLRHNVGFRIFSGLNEITITSKPTDFRGKTFNQIHIDGQATGFTQEMGIDWQAWYPIREIYCNALDETQGAIEEANIMIPKESETHFYIEKCEAIREIMDNWNDYFTNRRTDVILDAGNFKVYCGHDKKYLLYRRGVQCHKMDHQCLYHYDDKEFEINESRTLRNTSDATYMVAHQIAKYANKEMIRNIFDNYGENIEGKFNYTFAQSFNANWLDVINGRRLVRKSIAGHYINIINQGNCLILPGQLVDGLKRCFGDKVHVLGHSSDAGDHVIVDTTQDQKKRIDQAMIFLFNAGISVSYPVNVAIFPAENIMGSVILSSKTILLSQAAFEHGQKFLISTILEEYFHIKSGCSDLSRGFQDFIINQMVTNLEERSGVYL